jgi:site-specific recombinase XerD
LASATGPGNELEPPDPLCQLRGALHHPYFKKTRLADLSVQRIEAFQSWLLKQAGARGEQLSPATANHVVLALRLVVKWAIRQRLLSHDPFVSVEALATLPRQVEKIFALGPEAWIGSH